MDLTEGSETSAKHNLTPGKCPKEHIQEIDGFQRCQTYIYMYTTLKFLALQGAQYTYDISRLRVNLLKPTCYVTHQQV
jgi:hypothetical protein